MQEGAAPADATVEIVGALGSLSLPVTFHWGPLLARRQLLSWLGTMLVAGNADDDIMLEGVMLAGTACDETSAPLLAHAGLVRAGGMLCMIAWCRRHRGRL